jgi:succinate dehydrogenase/fumarate reductase cytochrome b subunit
MRVRRLVVAIAAVAAAVWLAMLAVSALQTAPAYCDNMAGTCLRQRQELALGLFAAVYSIGAVCGVWIAVRAAQGGPPRARHLALLVVSITVVIVALLVDPAGHLDNRYDGWLT